MTYRIPEENLDRFLDEIAKLNKRAAKLYSISPSTGYVARRNPYPKRKTPMRPTSDAYLAALRVVASELSCQYAEMVVREGHADRRNAELTLRIDETDISDEPDPNSLWRMIYAYRLAIDTKEPIE